MRNALILAVGCSGASGPPGTDTGMITTVPDTVTLSYTLIRASDLCLEFVSVERPTDLWEEWLVEECDTFDTGPVAYADGEGNCVQWPGLKLDGSQGDYCRVDDPGLGFQDCSLSDVPGCCENPNAASYEDCQ